MGQESVQNLPGFGNPPGAAPQLSTVTGRLLVYCERAVEGLTTEQLRDSRGETLNPPGFDVWHVVRTADNLVHFVFEREQPVWLREGFAAAWGLPRVDQGTGMPPTDAYRLPYPPADEFNRYTRAVAAAIVPRIAAMSDEYLATLERIRPWGRIPRVEALLHGIIGHGNGHLGRVSFYREANGLPGLGY